MRIDLPGDDRASYRVLVRVYNVAGRLVATPFDGELPPGSHLITWDGNGGDGARAASGVYFLRADAAGATRIRKAVILR
jgi:flagellar hook assembly protein FlgD